MPRSFARHWPSSDDSWVAFSYRLGKISRREQDGSDHQIRVSEYSFVVRTLIVRRERLPGRSQVVRNLLDTTNAASHREPGGHKELVDPDCRDGRVRRRSQDSALQVVQACPGVASSVARKHSHAGNAVHASTLGPFPDDRTDY